MDAYVWAAAGDPNGGVVVAGETKNNFGGANADRSLSTADVVFWRLSATGAWPDAHS